MLHRLALEAGGSLRRDECDAADSTAGRDDDLIGGTVLVERIGEQRTDPLRDGCNVVLGEASQYGPGIEALGYNRFHGSLQRRRWSSVGVATPADAKQYGTAPE
ncbi:MAG TPA: hypothetical protein VF695_08765 [Sphingomonas sp.]